MDSKFYDIPFLSKSSDSDFSCKDGEIANASGISLITADGTDLSLTSQYAAPPAPEIRFGLVRDILEGWHISPDAYPTKTALATDSDMEFLTDTASKVFSQFLSDAALQHLFVSPFYITGVWKTVTGEYLSPARPVMLTPNSVAPVVALANDVSSKEPEFRIAAALCSIYYKLDAPEILRDWVGKIASLEILVSDPLQKYDTYRGFFPARNVTTASWCETLDPSSGITQKERICSDTFPLAWKPTTSGSSEEEFSTPERTYSPFLSIPFSQIHLASEWTPSVGNKNLGSLIDPTGQKSLNYTATSEWSTDRRASEKIILQGTGTAIEIESRPLKFSSAAKFKHFHRLYLRGSFNPGNLNLSIFGSRDMITWHLISKREKAAVAAFPKAPFRFYKFRIEGVLNVGETLEGFSVIGN